MNRIQRGPRGPKVRIGISPDPTLLEWVDQNTGAGKRFATRTHAFEAGIACLLERSAPKGEAAAAATQRRDGAARKPQPSRT